jgi:hypothetical protein
MVRERNIYKFAWYPVRVRRIGNSFTVGFYWDGYTIVWLRRYRCKQEMRRIGMGWYVGNEDIWDWKTILKFNH